MRAILSHLLWLGCVDVAVVSAVDVRAGVSGVGAADTGFFRAMGLFHDRLALY